MPENLRKSGANVDFHGVRRRWAPTSATAVSAGPRRALQAACSRLVFGEIG